MKELVKQRLLKKGNSENDVNNMIEKDFDFASSKYNTVKEICNYLRINY
jgi:hypothetical protein